MSYRINLYIKGFKEEQQAVEKLLVEADYEGYMLYNSTSQDGTEYFSIVLEEARMTWELDKAIDSLASSEKVYAICQGEDFNDVREVGVSPSEVDLDVVLRVELENFK